MNYEHELHATAWQFAKDFGLEPDHVEEIKEMLRPMYETQAKIDLAFRTKVYHMMSLFLREIESVLDE